jgi:hypothetical protein
MISEMIDAYLDDPVQNGGLSFVVDDTTCMISLWWKKSSENRSFTFYFNISPDNASLKRPHSSTEHHASSLRAAVVNQPLLAHELAAFRPAVSSRLILATSQT